MTNIFALPSSLPNKELFESLVSADNLFSYNRYFAKSLNPQKMN